MRNEIKRLYEEAQLHASFALDRADVQALEAATEAVGPASMSALSVLVGYMVASMGREGASAALVAMTKAVTPETLATTKLLKLKESP